MGNVLYHRKLYLDSLSRASHYHEDSSFEHCARIESSVRSSGRYGHPHGTVLVIVNIGTVHYHEQQKRRSELEVTSSTIKTTPLFSTVIIKQPTARLTVRHLYQRDTTVLRNSVRGDDRQQLRYGRW
jgi:hypothetical protein